MSILPSKAPKDTKKNVKKILEFNHFTQIIKEGFKKKRGRGERGQIILKSNGSHYARLIIQDFGHLA